MILVATSIKKRKKKSTLCSSNSNPTNTSIFLNKIVSKHTHTHRAVVMEMILSNLAEHQSFVLLLWLRRKRGFKDFLNHLLDIDTGSSVTKTVSHLSQTALTPTRG